VPLGLLLIGTWDGRDVAVLVPPGHQVDYREVAATLLQQAAHRAQEPLDDPKVELDVYAGSSYKDRPDKQYLLLVAEETVTKPKLGDQVVAPPDATVVTDPSYAAPTEGEITTPTPAEPPAEAVPLPLEDGTEVMVPPGQGMSFQVRDATGKVYEHVSENDKGDWLYRAT